MFCALVGKRCSLPNRGVLLYNFLLTAGVFTSCVFGGEFFA